MDKIDVISDMDFVRTNIVEDFDDKCIFKQKLTHEVILNQIFINCHG